MADVGARIVAGGCSTEQLATIRKDLVFSRRMWSLFFRWFPRGYGAAPTAVWPRPERGNGLSCGVFAGRCITDRPLITLVAADLAREIGLVGRHLQRRPGHGGAAFASGPADRADSALTADCDMVLVYNARKPSRPCCRQRGHTSSRYRNRDWYACTVLTHWATAGWPFCHNGSGPLRHCGIAGSAGRRAFFAELSITPASLSATQP